MKILSFADNIKKNLYKKYFGDLLCDDIISEACALTSERSLSSFIASTFIKFVIIYSLSLRFKTKRMRKSNADAKI